MADDQTEQTTPETDDTDTADDTTEQAQPPTVETLQAELDRMKAALKKANRDAERNRRRATETPPVDVPDVDKVRAETEQATAGKYKPMVVKAHARTAFVEAGLVLPKDNHDTAMARVLKLLDLDDLDITDDGQVDGLREQVEDIRRDFPELFATTNGRRVPRVDGADRGAAPAAPKSSAEKLAATVMGARR